MEGFDVSYGGNDVVDMPQGKVVESNLMVWHRMDSKGHSPGAREGHSACAVAEGMLVFGGIEAGLRMSTVHDYNVKSGQWTQWSCTGNEPAPRAHHACCSYDDRYMFVQGGECTDLWGKNQPDEANTGAAGGKKHGEMRQVCMGDSIAMNSFGSKMHITHANRGEGFYLRCLDDLYMLDMSTKYWTKVPSSLSPLPRRGHTLNVVTLDVGSTHKGKRDYLFLFGGFNAEDNVVGNSVHICKVDDATGSRGVAWRLLPCTGDLPEPRHRHTTTPVWSSADKRGPPDCMVVMGGLDKHNCPLADCYVLDLKTLVWTRGSTGTSVEVPGVYGHVAFSAPPFGTKYSHCDTQVASTTLVIFGGSTNPSNACLDCLQKMYAYDLTQKKWATVDTGYEYPAQRSGHSVALVSGWAPENASPPPIVPNSDEDNNGTTRSHAETLKDLNRQSSRDKVGSASALIFGGLNANSMCQTHVWALDLEWRVSGVGQYDDSLHSIGHREMMRETQGRMDPEGLGLLSKTTESDSDLFKLERKKRKEEDKVLARSKSAQALGLVPPAATTKAAFAASKLADTMHVPVDPGGLSDTVILPDDANDIDLEEIGSAMYKVKKERIHADMQRKMEQDRANTAEAEVVRLKAALKVSEAKIADLLGERDKEGKELRDALKDAVDRCRELEALNEEAYKLLMLQGSHRNLGAV